MPGAANVIFNEVDDSITLGTLLKGISAVVLQTVRGPVAHDGTIVTSWEQFRKTYGGFVSGDEGALLAYVALTGGAKLRVSRVLHYTTPSNPATLDAVKAVSAAIDDAGDNLFSFTAKHHGVDYNNLEAVISNADNGDATYFNLTIQHTSDSFVLEEYTNLKINGTPTVAESNYLLDVEQQSEFVDVTYIDASGYVGPLRPDNGTYAFTTGSNGGVIVDADYVGVSGAFNGIYAFDNQDDFFQVTVLGGTYSATVNSAVINYADARKDCVGIAHIANSNTSASTIEAARASLPDSSYGLIYAGGSKIPHPDTGTITEIAEHAHLLGVIASVHSDPALGEWHSPAGKRKARVTTSLGVVNNFGSQGQFANRDLLANRQVNLLITRGGVTYFDGNFTSQLANSLVSFTNVRYLMIYLRKIITPFLENYIEEPNIPRTWRDMYLDVQPELERLTTDEAAALSGYNWQGDQFVDTVNDVVINSIADISQGKYKVKLVLQPIVSIQTITINAILTRTSVELTEEV